MYGSEIAYQVRFEGTKTANTKILFLTEGLLLRQFAADSKLSKYNVIIVDEVHERHITGDFLLGVLKRLLNSRDDIRIVLMSATINAELFSNYFNAPVVQIPGRVFPVRIEYLPAEVEDRNLIDDRLSQKSTLKSIATRGSKIRTGNIYIYEFKLFTYAEILDHYLKILERIDQVVPANERGDLLVFLSGLNEIITVADELKRYANYTKYLYRITTENYF